MPDVISWADAKTAGLTRYFIGRPCPKGHVCERMVSNRDCIDCMRARSKADYGAKGDAIRTKRRAYMRQAYKDNPEKFKARGRANYAADPEAYKEKVRDYEQRNPLKVRAWQRLKKHKNVPGRFTDQDLAALFTKQDSRCVCGKSLAEDWTIDHIVPTSRGGTHWPDNIQLLCMSCNASKHIKTMAEWLPK